MRPKTSPVINVSGIGLADCWQQLVQKCMKEGMEKKRDYGGPVKTYDIISTTEIKRPMLEPMLHSSFPTKQLHCAEYEKQWERDYDWIAQGFAYNYMHRLTNYPATIEKAVYTKNCSQDNYYSKCSEPLITIDQLSVINNRIANRIKKGGECLVSNRDTAITWSAERDLFVNEDQPCLQRLWIQVFEYPWIHTSPSSNYTGSQQIIKGKAEFHCMWRSRDLFAAWNSNMVGLIKMMIREIFEPNNLELIRVIDFCNSLHIYESDWEAAGKIKQIAINPQYLR